MIWVGDHVTKWPEWWLGKTMFLLGAGLYDPGMPSGQDGMDYGDL